MEFFFFLALGGMYYVLNRRANRLERRVRDLTAAFDKLAAHVVAGAYTPPAVAPAPQAPPEPPPTRAAAAPETLKRRQPSPLDKLADAIRGAWPKIEHQIVSNWTGIIGVLAVIVGVGYLGIYAAMKMDAFGRFLLMCGFAGGLFAGSVALGRKEYWKQIALWLRSGAGAVFLLACVASSTFELMQWVTDPSLGLALLALGIAANTYLILSARHEVFASLHVVFNLAALALAPHAMVILMLGAFVSLSALWAAFRVKEWGYHLMGTVVAFTAFHLNWKSGNALVGPDLILAAGASLAVNICALAIHYQQSFVGTAWNSKHHRVHILTWLALGANLMMYSSGTYIGTTFLAVASLAALFASQRAHRTGTEWVFVTDRFVALVLALLAALSIRSYVPERALMGGLALIVATLFLLVLGSPANRRLSRSGLYVFHATFFVWFMVGLANLDRALTELPAKLAITLLPLAILAAAHGRIVKLHEQFLFTLKNGRRISGVGAALQIGLIIPLLIVLARGTSTQIEIAFSLVLLVSLGLRYLIRSYSFEIAGGLVQGALILIMGIGFLATSEGYLPMAAVAAWCAISLKLPEYRAGGWRPQWLHAYASGFAFLTISFALARPFSMLLPGMMWLIGAQLALSLWSESKNQSSRRTLINEPLLGIGLALIAAYLLRHVLYELTEFREYFGVRMSTLGEIYLLAITAQVLWKFRASATSTSKWAQSFLEITIAAYLVFAITNFSAGKSFLLHGLVALALWLAQPFLENFPRVTKYAFAFFFVSLFQLSFVASTHVTPTAYLMNENWVWGLAGILVLTVFVCVAHRQSDEVVKRLRTGAFLPKAGDRVARRLNAYLILPHMIGIAFFLYWSFDRTTLSMLWMAELFALFSLSLWLREKHFRSVSMAGLVVLLVRMLFYDLRGQDFFVKALVFLAVGGLLIAMNAIYNRYKHRFEEERK